MQELKDQWQRLHVHEKMVLTVTDTGYISAALYGIMETARAKPVSRELSVKIRKSEKRSERRLQKQIQIHERRLIRKVFVPAILQRNVPAAIFSISELAKIKAVHERKHPKYRKTEYRTEIRRSRQMKLVQTENGIRNFHKSAESKVTISKKTEKKLRRIQLKEAKNRRLRNSEMTVPALHKENKLSDKAEQQPKTRTITPEKTTKLLYLLIRKVNRKLQRIETVNNVQRLNLHREIERIHLNNVASAELLHQETGKKLSAVNIKIRLHTETKTSYELSFRLIFAWILFLLLRTEGKQQSLTKNQQRTAENHTPIKNRKLVIGTEADAEPTLWILLSIIRYLALIREQNVVSYQTPVKQNKSKGQKRKSVRMMQFSGAGIIYAYEK
jgi:hypothetical protein